MNIAYSLIAIGAVASGAYAWSTRQPADVYAMPVSAAYTRLVNVDFGALSGGERALDTTKTARGNDRDQVTWTQQGDMSHRECTLKLKPWEEDADKTHVTVTCAGGGAGDGAAAGMVHNLHRNRVIERVDATLTDRAYTEDRAGSTARSWPGDGVDGSLETAVGEAHRMDRDMKASIRETN